MNYRDYIIWFFTAMVLVQIVLPLRTVYQHETILRSGNVYKFSTAPVDPNDPFRGRYVSLGFRNLQDDLPVAEVQQIASSVTTDQKVYIPVTADERGYVKATGLQTSPPTEEGTDYFIAEVDFLFHAQTDSAEMRLRYPFERFFMEEFKAPEAEDRYREALRDTTTEVYALVRIGAGISVLEDVLIDGKSLRED
ncbi:MAG: GDYXXLXY domain-containing protein [Bacteroidota bacterium]